MQSASMSQRKYDENDTACLYIQKTLQCLNCSKDNTFIASKSDINYESSQRSLSSEDICKALSMVDALYGMVDAEKIRYTQLEVNLEEEKCKNRLQLKKMSVTIEDLVEKCRSLELENKNLRLHIVKDQATSKS